MKKYSKYLITLAFFVLGLTFMVQNIRPHQAVFAACSSTDYSVHCNIIVTKYIAPAINFLTVGVGVVVLAMIIVGAIQYISSGDNPQSISSAKKKIINAILALIIYGLAYAFLNFIIPGGIIPL